MSCVKVLLVDDEPHIPMVVGRKLSSAGYEVITASDGEEGLAAANEFGPDLIITDLQMPYMSGAELAAATRRSATSPSSCSPPVATCSPMKSAKRQTSSISCPSPSACTKFFVSSSTYSRDARRPPDAPTPRPRR